MPFAESSGDTPETLPASEALQALQTAVDPQDHRFGERLAAPHGGDQERAGGEVGDVVLAEIDQGEAEGQRVAPAERALGPPRFRQEIAAISEVAKCSEGIAAQGLLPSVPYIPGQAEPQVSSPTSTMIRRTSSPVRPCSEDHQGGAVGAAK